MFTDLINAADAAARNILNNHALPAAARSLQDHAASFPTVLEPPLRTAGADAISVARQTQSTVSSLAPVVAAWKKGDAGAPAAILSSLQKLLASVHGNMDENQSSFRAMSGFRDQILADQRTVAAMVNDLRARQSALMAQIRDKQHDLNTQRSRLRALQSIPFPLPWMIAEIANLISSGKSIEQQIADNNRDLMALEGQMNQASAASSAAGGFAGQLDLLEGSLQNVLNALSIMQGGLQQMVGTLQATGSSTAPIVVEAYLSTLSGQADHVIAYLGDAKPVAVGGHS